MFLIIAGGGNVGYHLLRHQIAEGNEVVITEVDTSRCTCISQELGNLVINGDACDPAVLELAGIARAEMIVACTERDQDNLVICQIARKKFHVPYTIALANDPSNLDLFRKLGIDAAVSAIDAILKRIEQNIDKQESMVVLSQEGDTVILRILIPADSPALETPLEEITLPENCIISGIIRGGKLLLPSQVKKLQTNDILIALLPSDAISLFSTLLLKEETG